jgi:aconitate hydratase
MNKYKKTLNVGKDSYTIFSLNEAKKQGFTNIDKLPKSMKILLENLLRNEDGKNVTFDDFKAVNDWADKKTSSREIAYYPARVVMQDFTGVPGVVDLATMREGMVSLGGSPQKINPLTPVDLVIDHSVSVESFGTGTAFEENVKIEYDRNMERYKFLKWGQKAFKNFRVVPPGTGIIHQVNLEYLADVVWTKKENNETFAFPDTCVGTDSHTTMINGLSVLGWGVGGIEAEAAMLGQPMPMLIPDVVGFKLIGKLPEGSTATDLVLFVTQMLRKHGVVNKFVEFYGQGMSDLSLADRATIANMAPEYGATCGFFPIDEKTIDYLKLSGRKPETIKLVEAYAKEQGLWFDKNEAAPVFTSTLELDLSTVLPCISGPKRPQDKVLLSSAAENFKNELKTSFEVKEEKPVKVEGQSYELHHGDVVMAAITSCTNTSNPSVMLAAGLVAKKANELGLKRKPWVKTSLAPGSQVVTDYLIKSGLQTHLDKLGFNLVGYGCTTCIGNSGPLAPEISNAINSEKLIVCSVLSGNRNFEGRINPDIKANYLMSPPLVVAYALAGTMKIDIYRDPIGKGKNGEDVYLSDVWPSNKEIENSLKNDVTDEMFTKRYSNVFEGDHFWKSVPTASGELYSWEEKSTYVRRPTYFDDIKNKKAGSFEIKNASILALLGDSVTTDHISPAGSIKENSPAGIYLKEHNIKPYDFNSYGSRRGNHEVMVRGTFANIRIKNEMIPGVEGGFTLHIPTAQKMSIYDASVKYLQEGTPLVIIAGKEYGTGSSRDWAAKGVYLQGVKAVVCESFERIHRSNLVGMGVLPLEFPAGVNRKTLNLTGLEKISLSAKGDFKPRVKYEMKIERKDGSIEKVELTSRVDTLAEIDYLKEGGILQYVLRKIKG